jgi:serine/threonine-protein kinase
MFGKLFGSKKPDAPKARSAAPKLRRVNLEKRFTIIAETGQGSMSKVYRALDNQSGRTICLKVQDKAKTAAAVARSVKADRPPEGEIALAIVHPHVVRTYEHGDSTKGDYFIVMEFVEGVSLNFIRESRAHDLPFKIELLAQSAEALAAVHAAGYIHHDFGPKNILVNRDNQVKLIDFGLAVPNTPAFRRPGNRTGTLSYMAPELIRREPTDERLDIFAYGATAFEFLTGRLPYDASVSDPMAMMRVRVNSEPMKLAKVAPHLPADLCDIIQRTLARRKDDRWASMAKLADALRELPVASS